MYAYPLKAERLDKEGFEIFTVLDGICRIDDEHFILMNKTFSPILKLFKVRRGNEDGTYFEGDLVKADGKLYKVTYGQGGFRFDDIPANHFENVTALCSLEDYIPPSRKILFKYQEHSFSLSSLRGSINEMNLSSGGGWFLMQPEKIQLNTLAKDSVGRNIYFGDTYKDGIVIMHKGRIMIKRDTELIQL